MGLIACVSYKWSTTEKLNYMAAHNDDSNPLNYVFWYLDRESTRHKSAPTIPEARGPALPSTLSSAVPLAAIHGGVIPEKYPAGIVGIAWKVGGSSITSSGSGATSPGGQVSGSRNHPACRILICKNACKVSAGAWSKITTYHEVHGQPSLKFPAGNETFPDLLHASLPHLLTFHSTRHA